MDDKQVEELRYALHELHKARAELDKMEQRIEELIYAESQTTN